MQASTTAQHPDWIWTCAAAIIASMGTVMAVKVWKGEPVNRHNSLQQERSLAVLKVAVAPSAVAFWAAAIGLICLDLGGKANGTSIDLALIVVASLMGLIFLCGIVAACSLFFFTWPTKLVPPLLRR